MITTHLKSPFVVEYLIFSLGYFIVFDIIYRFFIGEELRESSDCSFYAIAFCPLDINKVQNPKCSFSWLYGRATSHVPPIFPSSSRYTLIHHLRPTNTRLFSKSHMLRLYLLGDLHFDMNIKTNIKTIILNNMLRNCDHSVTNLIVFFYLHFSKNEKIQRLDSETHFHFGKKKIEINQT